MSEKKRTAYKTGSNTTLPNHVDKTKFGYRWINANRLGENTDQYDPRNWELDKNAEGKTTRRGDLILGRMPVDVFESMKEQKDEDRKSQLAHMAEDAQQNDAQLEHSFKKSGGRIKSDFSLTKN